MKKNYTLILTLLLTIWVAIPSAKSQNLLFDWARAYGSNASSNEDATSVVTDDFGNVYFAGKFADTVDFDPGVPVNNLISRGSMDIFVQKLDSAGNVLWTLQIGGTSSETDPHLALDQQGNLIVAGTYHSTVDFDPGAGVTNLTATAGNIFVAKYSPLGNLIWAKSTGGSTVGDISLHTDQTIYVTGTFYATHDFDPSVNTHNLTSNGLADIYVQKLDSAGGFLWAKGFGGTDYDYGYDLCTDENGNVYATGAFKNTADFDPGVGTNNLTSSGRSDIYIVKLTTNGDFSWAGKVGSTLEDLGYGIAYEGGKYIYLTGAFRGTVDFDIKGGVHNETAGSWYDFYVQKLDTVGDLQWVKVMYSGGLQEGRAIEVDANKNVIVSGRYNGNVDFDPSAGTHILTSTAFNGFTQSLDSLGNFRWAYKIDNPSGHCDNYAVTADNWGNVYSVGFFFYTADLDPGSGNHFVTSNGNTDFYVQKLKPCLPDSSINTISACVSYTWIDGNTYNANNDSVFVVLTNALGCDSVVTLNLTILNATTGIDVVTACNSYSWIDGMTYYTNNFIATHTLTNADGCDSVVTLNLTINQPSAATDVIVSCGSYTWIDGVTYNSSNTTARDTLLNAVGCDSIITLNLTINQSSAATDVIVSCGSYTWIDGVIYNSSNTTARDTLLNAVGCDSIITLNLTINQPSIATDVIVSCGSYTWIDGVTYNSSSTTARDTLVNAVGCDSVITLDLTINQPSMVTDVIVSCGSYTWIDGVTYNSNNSTATDTLVNGVGCDSIVILNLTILPIITSTDVVTTCSSYTWIDGITYTSSNNTATDTLVSALGCDSIVTLDLTINQPTSATDVVVACGSYIWIDGNTYTSSNNNASDTLVNALGCDSIVTLNLTINQPTSATDVVVTCGSYTWIDGNTYTMNNTSATHTLTNAAGCDSVVTLELTINTVDVSVTVNEFTITANLQGASYQWLDCNDNYAIILNETNASFIATKSGRYAVEITDNGCADTSTCEELINVGINEPNALGSVNVYPNPNQGLVNVDLNNLENVTVKLISVNGKTLFMEKGITDNQYQFEFDGASGVYFVIVSTDTEQRQFKLIKHEH